MAPDSGQTVNDHDFSSAVGLFHMYASGLVLANAGIKNQEITLESLVKARNLASWAKMTANLKLNAATSPLTIACENL